MARSLAACAAVKHRADRAPHRRGADERASGTTHPGRTQRMCGIVAYTGPRQGAALVLEGLKRLEYRGYDSAGLAVVNDSGLEVHKAPGKIAVLEKRLAGHLPEGHTAMAHTRWATHGAPTEANAHPHTHSPATTPATHNPPIQNPHPLPPP